MDFADWYFQLVDYGVAVAGKPTFEVLALDDYAQIEVKYSEAYK